MRNGKVQVAAEPLLHVLSVRQSRRHLDRSAVTQLLSNCALALPARPTEMLGDAANSCGWIEPRAWLITATRAAPPQSADGLLLTDISDRTAAFRICGDRAMSLIAAGCDPAIVTDHGCTRARFANLAIIIIQRWSRTDWRLMVDVSLACAFAEWLENTATSIAPDGHTTQS